MRLPNIRAALAPVRLIGLAALLGLGGLSGGPAAHAQGGSAGAQLFTEAGDAVGVATFWPEGNGIGIRAEVANLPPGWHGFHVHTSGVCDASTQFMSAGGHLDLGASALPGGGMSGDLTNLYVQADGTGVLLTRVDRFRMTDLLADGGRALIVHADPDNFRNIPSRYNVTIDETTMTTGDAGTRIACGLIQPS